MPDLPRTAQQLPRQYDKAPVNCPQLLPLRQLGQLGSTETAKRSKEDNCPALPGSTDTRSPDLGDRLRRLATWADATPHVHRTAVSIAIDRLATLLGMALDGLDDQEGAR